MQFIAQKGKPTKMISDNSRNFFGAEREVSEYSAASKNESVTADVTILLQLKTPLPSIV